MTAYTLLSRSSVPNHLDTATESQVLGVTFTTSAATTLTGIWFYSYSGAAQLPAQVGLFSGATGHAQVFTDAAPSWSGTAGSGWVKYSCSQAIAAGTYCAAAWNGLTAGKTWYAITSGAWGPVTSGPLSCAASPDSFADNATSWQYPATAFSGFNIWLDPEVTASSTITATGGLALRRPSTAGTGSVVPPPVTASGGLILRRPALGGSAAVTVTAAGGLAMRRPAMSGAGSVTPPAGASGSLAVRRIGMSGTATVTVNGSGGLQLRRPGTAGTAAVTVAASGGMTLRRPGLAGTGTVTSGITAAGGLVLRRPGAAGTGNVTAAPVTATGTLTLPRPGMSGTASWAYPQPVAGVTVTWTASDIAGAAVTGTVAFRLSDTLVDTSDGDVFIPGPVTWPLSAGTAGPVLANDGATLLPAGSSYTVTITPASGEPKTWRVTIRAAAGTTQSLADLIAEGTPA